MKLAIVVAGMLCYSISAFAYVPLVRSMRRQLPELWGQLGEPWFYPRSFGRRGTEFYRFLRDRRFGEIPDRRIRLLAKVYWWFFLAGLASMLVLACIDLTRRLL